MTTTKAYKFTPISNAQFNTIPTFSPQNERVIAIFKPSLYIPKKGSNADKLHMIFHFIKDNEPTTEQKINQLQREYQEYQLLTENKENTAGFFFNNTLSILRQILLNSEKISQKDRNRIFKEFLNIRFNFSYMPSLDKLDDFTNNPKPIEPRLAATNPFHPSFKTTTLKRIPSKAITTRIVDSSPLKQIAQQPPTAPQPQPQQVKFTPISLNQFNTIPKFTPIPLNQFNIAHIAYSGATKRKF